MVEQRAPVSQNDRLPELEGLRGLLALWVLGYHVLAITGWWDRLPASLRPIVDGGNAVDVFILLSGFVITSLLLARHERYPVFLFRRYARLMPVFVLCIAAALVVQALGYMPKRYAPDDLVPLLWANAALLHGAIPETWIPRASGAILNPAWSISLEWQFYLIAPVLVALLSKGGWRFIAGSMLCVLLYRIVAPQLTGFTAAFLPLKIQLFWIGIVSCLGYRWTSGDPGRRAVAHAAALALCVAVLLLLPYRPNIGLLIWAPVMVMLTGRRLGVARLLGARPIATLGAISYPLYLLHEVVIWLLVGLWKPHGLAGLALLLIAVTMLTIALSWLLHIAVELPANRFAKRQFSRA